MRSLTLRAPRDSRGRFVNWSNTVTSTPLAWRLPASEDEVVEIVRAAAREGRKVRVVGAGHSWSEIAAPHEIALSLDRMQGVVEIDDARSIATVRAGTRLERLNAELARVGRALPIVGSIAHQSLAGAIGTGTHGSSLVHGNLSSLVEGVRIVTGRGEALDLDARDPRLEGARVHLGALGVLTQIRVRVCPAFRLAETVEAIPIDSAGRDLIAIARSAEYAKVWWVPHTKRALAYRYEKTTESPSSRPSPATVRWFDDVVMHGSVFPRVIALSQRHPRLVPAIATVVSQTLLHARRIGPSHLMLSTPMPLVHRETEAALPMDLAGEALERVVRMIDREGVRALFPLEVRFVKGDSGWMSPAHGRDTCQIGAYTAEGGDLERYFAGFWREMRAMGARPHWGKEMDHWHEELRALYPEAGRFTALRDELDPERRFGGPFHTRALGA
jgi:L-gulono-1,4-lactone dehydrogenase